jgi:S1-C subfamily serine protease
VSAKLKGDALEPAPQPGFSGAAALDSQGRVVGMVGLKTAVVANAGAAGTQQAMLVPAAIIRSFLERQKLEPAAVARGGDAVKASLVRVICVRK